MKNKSKDVTFNIGAIVLWVGVLAWGVWKNIISLQSFINNKVAENFINTFLLCMTVICIVLFLIKLFSLFFDKEEKK